MTTYDRTDAATHAAVGSLRPRRGAATALIILVSGQQDLFSSPFLLLGIPCCFTLFYFLFLLFSSSDVYFLKNRFYSCWNNATSTFWFFFFLFCQCCGESSPCMMSHRLGSWSMVHTHYGHFFKEVWGCENWNFSVADLYLKRHTPKCFEVKQTCPNYDLNEISPWKFACTFWGPLRPLQGQLWLLHVWVCWKVLKEFFCIHF